MTPSAGKVVSTFLGYAAGSTLWSLMAWGLMLQLHNRVEYFLVGPAQVLILGATIAPLLLAIVLLFLRYPGALKAAGALGLAIPALFTLALVSARMFA
ncbi:MAG: hypothetical protein QM758_08415 [Armatimonas sp.]